MHHLRIRRNCILRIVVEFLTVKVTPMKKRVGILISKSTIGITLPNLKEIEQETHFNNKTCIKVFLHLQL